jgi:hypothetical protein
MNSAQTQPTPSSKWFPVGMASLFVLQGIENLARRRDIPFGMVQLLMGIAVVFALVRKGPVASWVHKGILAVWVLSGAAEIALGRWIWGLFVLIPGALLILGLREEQRKRMRLKPLNE